MNQAQKEAYFERMKLAVFDTTGEEELSALIRAHLEHIPFENLTVFDFHQVPDLTEEVLFEKIILQKRGGYCFELNSLLLALLRELGYDAYPIAVRIIRNRSFLPPVSHMGVIVRERGEKYYCDVGYGGPGPKGLVCLHEGVQEIYGDSFRVTTADGDYRIERLHQGEWEGILQFEDHLFRQVDFTPLNFTSANNPDGLFTQKRVLYIYTPDGSKSMLDMEFTLRKNGEIRKTTCQNKEQLESCLLEEFGIPVTLPAFC
ncbi:MAG: arylamine N-acetyltransferase [Lachnospiraceae bacterium]|nr:arylamine N-acetyltransferase [Lachnospiraceae bacterium]